MAYVKLRVLLVAGHYLGRVQSQEFTVDLYDSSVGIRLLFIRVRHDAHTDSFCSGMGRLVVVGLYNPRTV